MISNETIRQVVAACDIVEVIRSYFPLRKSGANYGALCPFHREKSPSFSVSPQKQIFYCFGCHATGNVIGFVQQYEHITFPEAVRQLAARAGIAVQEETRGASHPADRTRERLLELHRLAAEWFHRNLIEDEGAAAGRRYLEGRGLTPAILRDWQIGYAPESWDALSRWAAARGFDPALLLRGGLVKPREEGNPGRGHYDAFRGRIMFPIHNDGGAVVGFSGRSLDPSPKTAKYVNSPETPIFHKGRILFGLHRSKRAIHRDRTAILCEGQMDIIACFEAGIDNVVAPLGTAFGEDHARLLHRYADEVVLCLDADAAGDNAAERIFPRLLEVGLLVRVAPMPTGEDPDSLLRKEGPDALRARLGAATDFIDHQIQRHARTFDIDTPRGKLQFARRLATLIAPLRDPVLRSASISQAARRIGIEAAELRALVPAPDASRPTPLDAAPDPATAVLRPSHAMEVLCRCALRDGATLAWLRTQPWPEVVAALPDGAQLARILASELKPDTEGSLALFLQNLPAEEASWLGRLAFDAPPTNALEVTRQWFERIRAELRLRTLRERSEQLSAQPDTPVDEINRVIQQILDLQRTLHDIDRPPAGGASPT